MPDTSFVVLEPVELVELVVDCVVGTVVVVLDDVVVVGTVVVVVDDVVVVVGTVVVDEVVVDVVVG